MNSSKQNQHPSLVLLKGTIVLLLVIGAFALGILWTKEDFLKNLKFQSILPNQQWKQF